MDVQRQQMNTSNGCSQEMKGLLFFCLVFPCFFCFIVILLLHVIVCAFFHPFFEREDGEWKGFQSCGQELEEEMLVLEIFGY